MRKNLLTKLGLLLTATLCLLPDVVAPQGSLVTTNFLEDTGSETPVGGITLTFVFDTTFSMYDDLQQLIRGAKRILDTALNRIDTPLYNFALVPFHDPGKYQHTFITNPLLLNSDGSQLCCLWQ